MADHDSIAMLIPWHVNGTLSAEERRSVEDHLRECAECRALLEEARAMEGLGQLEPDELLDHVQAQHLERYATDRTAMEPEIANWVSGHLDDCEVCRDALQILQRTAIDEVTTSSAEEASLWSLLRRTLLHPAAAAAYLIVIVLVIPAYRALIEIPGAESRIADLEQEVAGMRNWGGAVDLQVLTSAYRGAEQMVSVTVEPGQPLIPLGAEFEVPLDLAAGSTVLFRISYETGESVWFQELPVADVQRNLDDAGIVTLLLPGSDLAPGTYRLTVVRTDIPDSRPLLDARFEIRSAQP